MPPKITPVEQVAMTQLEIHGLDVELQLLYDQHRKILADIEATQQSRSELQRKLEGEVAKRWDVV